jgi:hypothetical protein
MCDPLVGGLIAGAVSLGAGAMQAQGQADMASKQQAANDQWVAYQQRIHQQQVMSDEAAREKADQARQETLQKVSPQAQQQTVTDEQARLNTLYNQKNPYSKADQTDPSSYATSGEKTGPGSGSFMTNLTQKVNEASQLARQRISNLATAGAYGGTFGGLATTTPIDFQQGAQQIQLQNDIRQGNLKTYGVEQQVQPLHYEMGSGTTALGGVATALAKIAGSGIGYGFGGGGATPSIPTGNTGGWM